MLLLLPLMLGLRMVLTKAAGAVLAPLVADRKATLAAGLVLSLFVLVRILPGWAGVLIGIARRGLAGHGPRRGSPCWARSG